MKRMLSIEEIWLLLVTLQSYKRFPAVRFDRVIGVDPCDHRTTATAAATTALLHGCLTTLHTTQRLRLTYTSGSGH
jgi:hypothetical protein